MVVDAERADPGDHALELHATGKRIKQIVQGKRDEHGDEGDDQCHALDRVGLAAGDEEEKDHADQREKRH